jgi:tRNA threonylcarbamoyladenosine biosynthesis protein TsaB
MRAVAIDTSSRRASVALWENGIILAREYHADRSLHAEAIMGLVQGCFGAAGWTPNSVDVCVCGIGPGSFTGVRVGLATAKGIAVGLDRPIVGIGSLDAMAWALRSPHDAAPGPIIALVDAGRGQVFGRLYGPDRRPEEETTIFQPGQLVSCLESKVAGDHVVAVGEVAEAAVGAQSSRLVIQFVRSTETDLPDAGILAELGVARLAAVGPDDLDRLEPHYGRAPDITTPKAL